ncbi:MAG: TetR/AcrR family transcriptional regulator C-terminal domain-containing protein [Candidatus Sericytochromatia bacterium]|nr:TetR/AcrR family transcriptional regulator C-terminal domain-containing protein [Candidatus Sericytochromatia bacterium]
MGRTPAKRPDAAAPRIPLTRERVLRGAIGLADELGTDALSMRKLAQSLGVEAMSLYNHDTDKDDVLDGMVDIVVGEIDLPGIGGDWQAAMRQRASSAYGVLVRHPWAAPLIVSRMNVGTAMLHYINATVGCLVEAGFTYALADRAWNAMDSYIYGFTLQKLNFPLEPEDYADAARHFLHLIPKGEYPYMNALSQLVIDRKHHGLHDLGFGLELILDGLERLRGQG